MVDPKLMVFGSWVIVLLYSWIIWNRITLIRKLKAANVKPGYVLLALLIVGWTLFTFSAVLNTYVWLTTHA